MHQDLALEKTFKQIVPYRSCLIEGPSNLIGRPPRDRTRNSLLRIAVVKYGCGGEYLGGEA